MDCVLDASDDTPDVCSVLSRAGRGKGGGLDCRWYTGADGGAGAIADCRAEVSCSLSRRDTAESVRFGASHVGRRGLCPVDSELVELPS